MIPPRALERRLAAVVISFATLLAVNDSLPYLGLRDDSCQTMFSSLEWSTDRNNHLFVPQHAVSDVWAYLEVRDVVITPRPGDGELLIIAEWLEAPDRWRNTEAIRASVAQLCRANHRVSFSSRRTDRPEALVHHADACAESALCSPHGWVPIRLYETDVPAGEAPR